MRGPKKSETIEIRLPHGAKQAFMARCQDRGVSASEVLRAFIDGEIAPAAGHSPRRRWIAGGLAVLAIGAVAAPSLARPSLEAQFARLDANRDGALSLSEFEAAAQVQVSLGGVQRIAAAPARRTLLHQEFTRIDADHDGRLTLDELRRSGLR